MSDAAATPPTPLDRDRLIADLNELTLPLMWTLRQEAMRAFDPLGIRPIKALLLELVARGLAHPKELSEVLDTVPPAISAMLGELEAKGLLERHPDPDDGRRVRLELTEAGLRLRSDLKARWHEAGHERLKLLGTDELAALIEIYRKVLAGTPT